MAAQPIEISIDQILLTRVDADPEAREQGRSAFIGHAIQIYLKAKERYAVDRQLRRAFAGEADVMLDEVADLLDMQEWPTD